MGATQSAVEAKKRDTQKLKGLPDELNNKKKLNLKNFISNTVFKGGSKRSASFTLQDKEKENKDFIQQKKNKDQFNSSMKVDLKNLSQKNSLNSITTGKSPVSNKRFDNFYQ